jgi:pilus assembly protein Flp/PilA
LEGIWQVYREDKRSSARRKGRDPCFAKEWGMRELTKLLGCEKGASAIEYALVATLISIAAIGAFNNLGNKINTMYNNVGNAM